MELALYCSNSNFRGESFSSLFSDWLKTLLVFILWWYTIEPTLGCHSSSLCFKTAQRWKKCDINFWRSSYSECEWDWRSWKNRKRLKYTDQKKLSSDRMVRHGLGHGLGHEPITTLDRLSDGHTDKRDIGGNFKLWPFVNPCREKLTEYSSKYRRTKIP